MGGERRGRGEIEPHTIVLLVECEYIADIDERLLDAPSESLEGVAGVMLNNSIPKNRESQQHK